MLGHHKDQCRYCKNHIKEAHLNRDKFEEDKFVQIHYLESEGTMRTRSLEEISLNFSPGAVAPVSVDILVCN